MQVRAMEKIKKHCTLLPYLFLKGGRTILRPPPKYNVGSVTPVPPSASYATLQELEMKWCSLIMTMVKRSK